MIDLKLDDDDLAVENGDFVLIEGSEVTEQLLSMRPRIPRGDIAWDERIGLTVLLGDGDNDPDFLLAKLEYTFAIATTPGVERVGFLNFDFSDVTREMTVDGEVFDGSDEPIQIKETLFLGGGQ